VSIKHWVSHQTLESQPHHRQRYLAWPPLMSNYKGFPICQAKTCHDESRSESSMETTDHQVSTASMKRKGCGLEKLQPVIDAVVRLRTLMEDARGGLIR